MRAVEPDGVRITHDNGIAKIKFEELPAELRAQFSIDPEKAAAFRAEQTAAFAAAAKERAAEKERIIRQQNAASSPPAASPIPVSAKTSAASADGSGGLPPPTGGKIYDIEDLRGKKGDLAGTVVRVRLVANSASNPEQNADGSFEVFVGGKSSKDDYTMAKFPSAARNYVKLFNKTARGEMTFYALVSAGRYDWLKVVGRSWDGRSYQW